MRSSTQTPRWQAACSKWRRSSTCWRWCRLTWALKRASPAIRTIKRRGRRAPCPALQPQCSGAAAAAVVSLITPYTSHLAPHTSHLAPHTSHLTPRTSHLTFDQELLRQRNRAGHARAPGTTALQPAPSLASRRPHAAPLSRAQVNGLRDAHALLLGMQRELAAIKQVYKRMCHIRRHTSHVTPLQPLQKLWTMRNGYCMPDSLDALRISWYILLLLLLMLLLPLLQRLIYDTRAHAQTPVSVV